MLSSSCRPTGETNHHPDGRAADAHHVIASRQFVADRQAANEVGGVSTGGRQEPVGDVGARPHPFNEQRPADQGVAVAHGPQQEASRWIAGRSLRPDELGAFRCHEERQT